MTRPTYPPAEDVALGVVSVIADRAWRAGSWDIATVTGITMRQPMSYARSRLRSPPRWLMPVLPPWPSEARPCAQSAQRR